MQYYYYKIYEIIRKNILCIKSIYKDRTRSLEGLITFDQFNQMCEKTELNEFDLNIKQI